MAIRYLNKDTPFEVPGKRGPGRPPGKADFFTRVQLATLQYWRAFEDEHGYPPTVREASEHFGLNSTMAMTDRCNACAVKGGMVLAKKGIARGMLLTKFGRSLTIGKETSVDAMRPLYIQTAHGFVGAVTQERKCACGQSHFTDCDMCADCARWFGDNEPKVVR